MSSKGGAKCQKRNCSISGDCSHTVEAVHNYILRKRWFASLCFNGTVGATFWIQPLIRATCLVWNSCIVPKNTSVIESASYRIYFPQNGGRSNKRCPLFMSLSSIHGRRISPLHFIQQALSDGGFEPCVMPVYYINCATEYTEFRMWFRFVTKIWRF